MELAPLDGNLTRPPRCDCSGVTCDDRIIGELLSKLPCDDLRFHWLVHSRPVLFHHCPPPLHTGLSLVQKSPITVSLQQRQQPLECALAVTDEADLDGVAQSNLHRVNFDLNGM